MFVRSTPPSGSCQRPWKLQTQNRCDLPRTVAYTVPDNPSATCEVQTTFSILQIWFDSLGAQEHRPCTRLWWTAENAAKDAVATTAAQQWRASKQDIVSNHRACT